MTAQPPTLEWFPKPMQAGDTAGEGARRTLGQPELDTVSLLVRETAQNSWDARLPGQAPIFQLRLHTLVAEQIRLLRDHVFTGASEDLGLMPLLLKDQMTVLEIADRNTSGLRGPLRNSVRPAPGEPNDYANFVLTIGAPPDTPTGGGTYGFGKTASYVASKCSTIIIWTRTRDTKGELVDRFIASAMGSTFALHDESTGEYRQFTGRQWWAVRAAQENPRGEFEFDPATGDEANWLGTRLFQRKFTGEETGTSILVLDPKGGDDEQRLVDDCRNAVVTNLWPKLLPNQPAGRRMSIGVFHEDEPQPLTTSKDSPILATLERCLQHVRSSQESDPDSDEWVTVKPIMCHRPSQLLGHLGIARVFTVDESDPMFGALNKVTYMRHEPELIVQSDSLRVDSEAVDWVAVFKPIAELDEVYAASEPPAHDQWVSKGLEDRRWRTFVSVTPQRWKDMIAEYVKPIQTESIGVEPVSTAALSSALAGIAGTASGSVATNRKGTSRRVAPPPVSRRPAVSITAVTPLPQDESDRHSGRQQTRLNLLANANKMVEVGLGSLALAIDGGSLKSGEVRLERWHTADGDIVEEPRLRVMPEQAFSADISYPQGLALDVTFVAGEI